MTKYPRGSLSAAFKDLGDVARPTPTHITDRRKARRRRLNKYHARKQIVDGYEFASGLEAEYYRHLKALKLDFKVHETFEILPKFQIQGKTVRKCVYTPDFSRYEDGKLISVVDTKGAPTMTDAARLRMKLFMKKYQVPVIIATWNRKTKTFNERKY